MQIHTGNEVNPFDVEAFNELNDERFGGSLTAVLLGHGEAMVTTPPDMSDKDLTDAICLVEIDNPVLH
jgi:hypothetical protein